MRNAPKRGVWRWSTASRGYLPDAAAWLARSGNVAGQIWQRGGPAAFTSPNRGHVIITAASEGLLRVLGNGDAKPITVGRDTPAQVAKLARLLRMTGSMPRRAALGMYAESRPAYSAVL